ncbi:MAG: polymer-forming cytoskeletal protein [Asticcacaulis sp.]
MFNKTSKPVRPQADATRAPVKSNVPPPLDMSTVNMKTPGATPVAAPVASAPVSAPVARGGLSSLAANLTIEGNISGNADLQVDGNVRGNVKVAHLIVGEAGNIEGDVEAETIEVRGRVVGAIAGKSVKLFSSAYVEGDISHENLSIDIGAYFQGRCQQIRRVETPAPVAVVNTANSFTAPDTSSHGSAMNSYDLSALSDLK